MTTTDAALYWLCSCQRVLTKAHYVGGRLSENTIIIIIIIVVIIGIQIQSIKNEKGGCG